MDALRIGIIPAYAGSTRSAAAPCAVPQGSSPHTRGAPLPSSRTRRSASDHPRIRGEHTDTLVLRGIARGIIPAYAGSTGSVRTTIPVSMGSSPHTRGALWHVPEPVDNLGIIPAYAGSTASSRTMAASRGDHPRIRGEHTDAGSANEIGKGSSPHTRGAQLRVVAQLHVVGIIPAYAGSTGSVRTTIPVSMGSSPHTRGALWHVPEPVDNLGIIPAYAGSTASSRTMAASRGDHPRIRGEHTDAGSANEIGKGSSPHTRGAQLRVVAQLHVVGIIPAYAGSTSAARRGLAHSRDHPRIRGEHRLADLIDPTCEGIIPAYAGSTLSSLSSMLFSKDHPRIRGEHDDLNPVVVLSCGIIPAYAGSTLKRQSIMPFFLGSSPHTRGAPSCGVACIGTLGDHPRIRGEHIKMDEGKAAQLGIIPAYAGSTRSGRRDAIRSRGSSPHTRGAPRNVTIACATVKDHPRIRGEHLPSQFQDMRGGWIILAYAGSTFKLS